MPSSHDDDLDWLYHRGDEPSEPEPEPTRAFPSQSAESMPSQASKPSRSADYRQRSPAGPPPARPMPPSRPAAGPRRRHPVRRTCAVVGILVLAAIVWLVGVPLYAWSHVDRVAYEPGGSRPSDQPGTTYLLLGSDSRSGMTKAEQKKYGTGHDPGSRTDSIMLVYRPPGGDPALISIPRDSYVDIPGHGKNKINAAYSIGGPKLMTKTVEADTGIRVDDYVEVGFTGFVDVIDSLGGVRMCLKRPMHDKDAHINLKSGCQNLKGANALGYVRARKSDPKGDLGRVERQRQMLAAMAKKAASPMTVIDPIRYWQVTNSGSDSLRVGDNTSAYSMTRLLLTMKKVAGQHGSTITVPVANSNYGSSAGSAVLWNQPKAKKLFSAISRGDTSNLKKYGR
jgi:LCP family protein required for cell wall assembly